MACRYFGPGERLIWHIFLLLFFLFTGIIYNFNTQLPKDILNKAEQLNIPVRSFDVIYKLLDDLKVCMNFFYVKF